MCVRYVLVIQAEHHFLGIDAYDFVLWGFFFLAHSSSRTGAVPNVRAVVLDIYTHCVRCGMPAPCRLNRYQLKPARCTSQGFVSARHVTLPTVEIMRYAWLWNCARLLMQFSFRLWAINATQQVSISPSLVLPVDASGNVYNRQFAF